MKRFLPALLAIFIVLSSFEINIYADRDLHKEFETLESFTARQNGFTERDPFDAEFFFSYVRRNMFFEEDGKYTLKNDIYYVPSADVRAFLENEFIVSDSEFENMKKLQCDYYHTDTAFDTLSVYDAKNDMFLLQSDYPFSDGSLSVRYCGYAENQDGTYDVYIKKYTPSAHRPNSGDYIVNYGIYGNFEYLSATGEYLVYNIVPSGNKLLKNSTRITEILPDKLELKPDEYEHINLMPLFEFAEKAPYKPEKFDEGTADASFIASFARLLFDYSEYYNGEKYTVPADVLVCDAYEIFINGEAIRDFDGFSYDEENDTYTFTLPEKADKCYFAEGYSKRSDGTYDVFLYVLDMKNEYKESENDKEYIDYAVKDGKKYSIVKNEGAVANIYYDGIVTKFVSWTNGVLEKDGAGYTRLKAIDGDTDGNGTLDADDAIYLLYHVYFPSDYPLDAPCDYNNDGKTDSDDAIYLLYHIYFGDDYKLHI